MSKLYRKPVKVKLDGANLSEVYWRFKWMKVKDITMIRPRYSWWESYTGDIYRIEVEGGGVYELVKDLNGWQMLRVWD